MDGKDVQFPTHVIGLRIRNLRKKKGITLDNMAHHIEISQGMLSQIEKGKAKPSLDTLWKLSRFLKVPVFTFFKDIDQNLVKVTRKEEQVNMRILHPNVNYRLLSPSGHQTIEVFELHVHQGDVSVLPELHHEGEEWGYVIKGSIEVIIEGEAYALNTGDAIYFDSNQPHKFHNPNEEKAVALWVMNAAKS